MSDRKSTTARARVVYTSPEGRVVVTRTEDADYILSVDNCCAGVYTTAHAAEVAGLVELEYRVKQDAIAAADEAADQAMDAALAARDFGAEDAPADEPAPLRLLWSWAGNAKALRGLMDERHAAWFARQERMRVTAGELGLLAREVK